MRLTCKRACRKIFADELLLEWSDRFSHRGLRVRSVDEEPLKWRNHCGAYMQAHTQTHIKNLNQFFQWHHADPSLQYHQSIIFLEGQNPQNNCTQGWHSNAPDGFFLNLVFISTFLSVNKPIETWNSHTFFYLLLFGQHTVHIWTSCVYCSLSEPGSSNN